VGEACTAELIQDQPGALAEGMGFDIPVIPLELPAYTRKENWGASETFFTLVRALLRGRPVPERAAAHRGRAQAPTCSAPPRSASAAATTSPR
jgi:light-independent protochlorophyllide reductase subunit B